jgi:hypothetical protein
MPQLIIISLTAKILPMKYGISRSDLLIGAVGQMKSAVKNSALRSCIPEHFHPFILQV